MNVVGIDPGQRHVGLCLLNGAETLFHEIKTDKQDVLTSIVTIESQLDNFLTSKGLNPGTTLFAIERQLSVGGQSSSLMFCMQMTILKQICMNWKDVQLVMPLPVQLRSYIKKVHGGDISSARATVKHFQTTTRWKQRISQHCVDAYYLARLAQDVKAGKWEYKLPSNEAQLFPGTVLNVNRSQPDSRSS